MLPVTSSAELLKESVTSGGEVSSLSSPPVSVIQHMCDHTNIFNITTMKRYIFKLIRAICVVGINRTRWDDGLGPTSLNQLSKLFTACLIIWPLIFFAPFDAAALIWEVFFTMTNRHDGLSCETWIQSLHTGAQNVFPFSISLWFTPSSMPPSTVPPSSSSVPPTLPFYSLLCHSHTYAHNASTPQPTSRSSLLICLVFSLPTPHPRPNPSLSLPPPPFWHNDSVTLVFSLQCLTDRRSIHTHTHTQTNRFVQLSLWRHCIDLYSLCTA